MRAWIAMGLLSLSSLVLAGDRREVLRQVEASLMVDGEITVDGAGKVVDYTLKEADKLPANVVDFLRGNIAAWTFEPLGLEGRTVNTRNDMKLMVVAKRINEESFLMRLQASSFFPQDWKQGYTLARRKMKLPRYPVFALRRGAEGTVYLVLKVGRDGRVLDAMAEQVNLRVATDTETMERLRHGFAAGAEEAARHWEFEPPTRGEEAEEAYWSVRVPVDFTLGRPKQYGRWVAYIPGPRVKAPWMIDQEAEASPEALADGVPTLVGGKGLRLRAPLASAPEGS